MTEWGIDPGGWKGNSSGWLAIKFDRGPDPVPADSRKDSPGLDGDARDIEAKVEVEIIDEFDRPFDPDDRGIQRFHGVDYPPGWAPPQRLRSWPSRPDFIAAGSFFWEAGSWWYRPRWSGAGDPNAYELGLDAEPALELTVANEREAEEHARKRVAWLSVVKYRERYEQWRADREQ